MLQVKQVVKFERRPHRVVMVNLSRAVIVPVVRATAEPIPASSVNPWPNGISISPNSELEVLLTDSAPDPRTKTLDPVRTAPDIQPELF